MKAKLFVLGLFVGIVLIFCLGLKPKRDITGRTMQQIQTASQARASLTQIEALRKDFETENEARKQNISVLVEYIADLEVRVDNMESVIVLLGEQVVVEDKDSMDNLLELIEKGTEKGGLSPKAKRRLRVKKAYMERKKARKERRKQLRDKWGAKRRSYPSSLPYPYWERPLPLIPEKVKSKKK